MILESLGTLSINARSTILHETYDAFHAHNARTTIPLGYGRTERLLVFPLVVRTFSK